MTETELRDDFPFKAKRECTVRRSSPGMTEGAAVVLGDSVGSGNDDGGGGAVAPADKDMRKGGSGNETENLAFRGAVLMTVDAGAGADVITTGACAREITGGLGDETLTGGAGDDFMFGFGVADVLVGGTGNVTLNGGAGLIDAAVFSGSWDDHLIWMETAEGSNPTRFHVLQRQHNDNMSNDRDSLTNVEMIQFGDSGPGVSHIRAGLIPKRNQNPVANSTNPGGN